MLLGLASFENDDASFLNEVDQVVRSMVGAFEPEHFMVFRIDNWFGAKWLRFEGKMLGAFGSWNNRKVIIPPFVQNRLTAQALFERIGPNLYQHLGEGENIHNDGPSSDNYHNNAKEEVPDTALFWFSGNSKHNGRGVIMGYVPTPQKYWDWYLQFDQAEPWYISHKQGLGDNDLAAVRSRTVQLVPLKSSD